MTPRLVAAAVRPAPSAIDPASSHRAVRSASQASALRNAEAFLSLAAEAESWE